MTTLDGLRWKPKWTTQIGCLKGCLEYLGIEMSDAWLFGGTGHAFVINIHEQLCPSGPTAWKSHVIHELGRNLGYTTDHVWAHKSHEAFAEIQKRAWEATKQAINDGLPCYGWELDIPEYYVIHGYDETGYYFNGPLCDDGKGPKPWQDLGNTEIGWVEVHFVKPDEPSDDAVVVKKALEFAVEQSEDPDKWSHELYTMGLAAYDLWIEAIQNDKADGFGTAFNAVVWAECREHARDFLAEAKGRLNGACTDLFDKAVRDYETVAAGLRTVSDVFPFLNTTDEQKEKNVKDPIRCRTALECLGKARNAEESGLQTLKKIAAEL